jgi:hypothetical protein
MENIPGEIKSLRQNIQVDEKVKNKKGKPLRLK